MSEKIRTLSLTTGNVLTTLATSSSVSPPTTATLIGAPTLISSTFNPSYPIQMLTPTMTTMSADASTSASTSAGVDSSPQNHGSDGDTDSNAELTSGAIIAQLKFHLLPADAAIPIADVGAAGDAGGNSIMNSSQISATSNESTTAGGGGGGYQSPENCDTTTTTTIRNKPTNSGIGGGRHLKAQSVAGKTCRFPKLEDCAHFHYERVQLGPLSVRLLDDKSELLTSSIASQSIGGDIASHINPLNTSCTTNANANASAGPASFRSFSPSNCWFIVRVFPHQSDPFLVKRSFDNMQMFDEMLHRCVYDRKISGLRNLQELEFKSEEDVEYAVAKYLERFSKIASDSLTCGTILTWLQLDNKGRRLPLADSETMRTINTPAVGAAYGVRRYQAQASDEISIEVGDMISVIDMPSPAESIWWRGKKSHLQKSHYEVGFFPQSCVATIGDKVPRNFPMPAPLVGQLDVSPTKPVLRKHGKLIAFFRSFILSRPSRRRLKQSGIYRERVFSCDLSEHLLNSGQEIPMVLKCCAEFIEQYGIVDGIYRLSGITSNIQRLRRSFDEERVPDLGNPEMKQDIHAVSSLLKMYFRELPNPLCTYQLYDNFVEAIQEKSESTERLRLMKETVLKLPPPHYRTLKYLSEHLNKISQHAARTNMTDKNLAIVWAPNLLRSPALESGGVAALRGVGVQAVVTEYLIRNCHNIFDTLEDQNARLSYIATSGGTVPAIGIPEVRVDSMTDCESLLVEQREHDQSLSFNERPKSLNAGGPKLISLEEAQERHSRPEPLDLKQSMPMAMITSNAANIGSYIEVGGGPSSLPDKYHTILDPPRNWQKRKTHSWKSIFTRNQRPVSSGTHDLKISGPHNLRTHRKDYASSSSGAQVTFAEADSIITGAGAHNSKKTMAKSGLSKQEKTKSIEIFETSTRDVLSKPMEVCVRSSSIDSLRTATGHSRSVSHDSYFDLLQSPQRGHVTTCPSRELSELGINFDREEPEMRIFSESESLVSSPRVGKENVPPSSAMASRRIMRARPEDFSSQTNSVNPSPKKQPRLNLLLSPHTAAASYNTAANSNWTHSSVVATVDKVDTACHDNHENHSGDESCCKRYKLEDQLSDIQFIDCSTPEHTALNGNEQPTTLFTSVQIHAPPKNALLSKSTLYGSSESTSKAKDSNTSSPQKCTDKPPINAMSSRYSYPSVQLGAKRKEQEAANSAKERFSYPSACGPLERGHTVKSNRMQIEETCNGLKIPSSTKNNLLLGPPPPKPPHLPKPLHQQHELLAPKNRNSYSSPNDSLSGNNSGHIGNNDTPKDAKSNEMERSKRSVTPSSPMHSPRYSLLTSETSSEHSSAVNTPQYDLDPLLVTSTMSGLSGLSGGSLHQQQQYLLGVDATSLGTSHESLGSNLTSHSAQHHHNHSIDKRDMHALKRELSLDLNPHSHKMIYEQSDTNGLSSSNQLNSHKSQHQLVPSPSNNSNFTDNTSQSVTPSEYGYQHLQRQSSMRSLLETSENSPAYEDDYENTPSNLVSPLGSIGSSAPKLPSPIKSTISITYNHKSPKHEKSRSPLKEQNKTDFSNEKPLLETSFDENTVYEQVRFFKNSITEVNQMLSNEEPNIDTIQEITEEECITEKEMQDCSRSSDIDVEMRTHNTDSLETEPYENINLRDISNSTTEDNDNDNLLYENVELRKPKSVYANLLGEEMRGDLSSQNDIEFKIEMPASASAEKLDQDSLDSIKATDGEIDNRPVLSSSDTKRDGITFTDDVPTTTARKSPSNFSVKELATKFETSPVEQLPAFDFSLRNSIKKSPQHFGHDLKASSQNSLPCTEKPLSPKIVMPLSPAPSSAAKHQSKPKLIKTQQQQQITRSLDESAFIREFGAKQLQEVSNQKLPDAMALFESGSNRRKSFDFTRPKTLNPPKRLPGMPIPKEIHMKRNESKQPHKPQLQNPAKLDLRKECNFNNTDLGSLAESSSLEHDFESTELKITPTTENRISLIQQNVASSLVGANDSNSNNTCSSNNGGLLSGVKLDRERIDRIKEERRQQLTQKYNVETFKSKTKIDLLITRDDSDKVIIESLRQKSKSRGDVRESLKDFERTAMASAGSESTLQNVTQQQRIRSISDEKNQNCVGTATSNTAAATAEALPKKSIIPQIEEFSTRTTALKFERKNLELGNGSTTGVASSYNNMRERRSDNTGLTGSSANSLLNTNRNSLSSTREKISPQFSIRDVTAMFESRAQNQ